MLENPKVLSELERAFETEPTRVRSILDDAELLLRRCDLDSFDMLVVLGSGYLPLAEQIGDIRAEFPFFEIPGVKTPTAQGHGDKIMAVKHRDKNILVYTGRSHLYEGLDPYTVCLPERVAAATGIKCVFLTNAGGTVQDWALGDSMTITDHINLSGASPFSGPCFTDISQVWDPELSMIISQFTNREGTYCICKGPEYQTFAESRYLKTIGVDMVGMSTVLEAIALHQLGIKVCGVSLVSDLSFSTEEVSQDTVISAVHNSLPQVLEAIHSVADSL